MADAAFDDFYNTGELNFHDLYQPEFQGGFGSDFADSYVGGMLGLSEARDNPSTAPADLINKNVDEVKGTEQTQMKQRINQRSQSILAQNASKQLDTLADLYANTGDPNLVTAGQDVQADAVAEQQKPVSSKVARMALQALKNDTLGEVDRINIARQANLAQLGEYMEYADMGKLEWLGTLIPFRNTYQFLKEGGTNSYSEYKDKIKTFKSLLPEEQINAMPAILDDMWKMAGENPFIFQDRVLPFIDREDINSVNAAFAFDAIDVASLVPFTKAVRFARAAINPARFARNAGARDVGGRLVSDVLSDTTGQTATNVGMTRTEAGATAMPFNGEGAIPEIVDGLSPYAQQEIATKLSAGRKGLSAIIYDPNLLVQRSPLTDLEVVEAQKKYLEQYAGNAVISESTPTGFTVDMTIENPKYKPMDWSQAPNRIAELQGDIQQYQSRLNDLSSAYGDAAKSQEEYKYIQNILIPARKELSQVQKDFSKGTEPPTKIIQKKIKYKRDDVGVFESNEFSKATPWLNSPETFINQMLGGIVEDSTVIDFTQHQLRKKFEDSARSTIKGINGRSKRKIGSILLQGDADKVGRYSTSDLAAGINTKDGLLQLSTPSEIAAYHGVRDIIDTTYLLKNRQLRRELDFDNWKSVRMDIDGEKITSFVKGAINEQGRDINQLPEDVKRLYDFASGKVVDVGSKDIFNRRLEKEGWLLMRHKYPVEVGDELIEYAIAKPKDIRPLPDRVLAYRPGYVPRIYKNIFYIAESIGDKVINGVKQTSYREVKRYFDGLSEGEEWANLQRSKGETIVVRPGREWLEMHPTLKQDYEAAVFGGLYSGKRSDSVIPFGLRGTEAEHIGAFEAMEKAMSHVSTRLPINEFRMGMIRRFVNSARDPISGKSLLENPGDWRSDLIGLPKTAKDYIGLSSMRTWMEDQFRIPTSQERAWGTFMGRLAQSLDGQWLRGPKRAFGMEFNPRLWMLNAAHKDIYAQMRSWAFHALLGWFNPSQLYVQALGASMAFSVAPQKAAYLMPRYLALRAAMFSDNPKVWGRTAVAAALPHDDMVELVRAFRKSGILDSVRSTADFDAAVRGYGIDALSLRRAADAGLFFFREGESLVRSYGWLLSHSDFMANKGRGYSLTDKDIDVVTKNSLKYTLNLNRANRAVWQKGFLSIPTQFFQITSKFIENMSYSLKGTRGKWSKWDKAKIMSGQAIMFGAAGIPFGQFMAQKIADWASSEEDYGLAVKDPEAIAAIRGGLLEMALYDWTGEHLAVSSRASIPSGVQSFLETVLRSDSTVGEKIAGAFGEVPSRLAQAIHNLAPIFVGYTSDMENWDTAGFAGDVALELADVTSTWRNIHKSFMWEHAKAILDSKGNPIIPIDPELDHSLIMAKRWGIEPRALEDYYAIAKYNQNVKDDIKEVADAWVQIARRYTISTEAGTPRAIQRTANMVSWITRGLSEDQKAKVAETVIERLKKDDYKLTKELLEALKNVQSTQGSTTAGYKGNLEFNTLMLPDTKQASGETNAK